MLPSTFMVVRLFNPSVSILEQNAEWDAGNPAGELRSVSFNAQFVSDFLESRDQALDVGFRVRGGAGDPQQILRRGGP